MDVIDQLKDNGYVLRGWLGVYIQEVTRELAESFGMDKPWVPWLQKSWMVALWKMRTLKLVM